MRVNGGCWAIVLAAFGFVRCAPSAPPRWPTPAVQRSASAERAPIEALLDSVTYATVQQAPAPVAGLAVAVVQHGQVLLRRGYGFADIDARVPMPVDAVFRVGSITKQFTAAAVMRSVRAGRVALGDAVGQYLAGLPPQVAALTVRQLLNQTTGLANYTALPWFQQNRTQAVPAAELLARVGAQPLAFVPGTKFNYSNSNYYLLGLVIEQVAGRPYADVIRTELAAPAGLTDTAMCPDAPADRRAARGYRHEGRALTPALPLSMATPFAAGGLCSTVDDLSAWARALATGRVVDTPAYAQMTAPPTLGDGTPSTYGFGLIVDQVGTHRRVHHGGGINGFASQLAYFPDDELTIAVLANTEGDLPDTLAERLARAALGVPEPVSLDLPVSANEAAPLVGTYSIAALGQTLAVRFEHGALRLGRAGQPGPGMRMRAQGGDVFAAPDIYAVLRFHVVEGLAATMTIEQAGQTFEATRVPDRP